MPLPQVSVVVPSFNRHEATESALRSIAGQTRAVREVIVVDDGSNPPLVLERLTALAPGVRLLRNEKNAGAAAARQRGIDAATSSAVAFLDTDDLWHPRKLEDQLPLLGSGLVAVSCGWQERNAYSQSIRTRVPISSAEPTDFLAGCWFCPGSTVLIKRETLRAVGAFDTRLRRLEDLEWFARFGRAGGRLLVVPSVKVTIAHGGRARRATVEPAARKILETAWALQMCDSDRRTLRAWLDVERARAAWNESQQARAVALLLRSMARRPRFRLHLRDWWPEHCAA